MRLPASILLGVALVAGSGFAGAAPAQPPQPAPAAPPAAPARSEEAAWLGIVFGDALDGGVQIVAVVPGGPADDGGVREGDVLLSFGGRSTPDRAALLEVVRTLSPGEDVVVRLVRKGRITETALRPLDPRRREYPLFELRRSDPSWTGAGPGTASAAFGGFDATRIPRELRVHYGAPADAGVLVVRVDVGGAAASSGLRVGDVIVKVSGRPVEEPLDVVRALARAATAPTALDVVRARKALVVRLAPATPAAGVQEADRLRLEAERLRLQRELERVEAEMERLRKLER
jgi:S1-C subfamily serine protease